MTTWNCRHQTPTNFKTVSSHPFTTIFCTIWLKSVELLYNHTNTTTQLDIIFHFITFKTRKIYKTSYHHTNQPINAINEHFLASFSLYKKHNIISDFTRTRKKYLCISSFEIHNNTLCTSTQLKYLHNKITKLHGIQQFNKLELAESICDQFYL